VGDVSQPLATAGETPVVAGAAIAGFDFTFGSDDSDLLGVGVSCGAVQDVFATGGPRGPRPGAGTLTGSASFSGSVDAALLALTVTAAGDGRRRRRHRQPRRDRHVPGRPYLDGQTLGSAALFIQSFFASSRSSSRRRTWISCRSAHRRKGIQLNTDQPGAITYEGTQQLAGTSEGKRRALRVRAVNLQTNSLLVALAG